MITKAQFDSLFDEDVTKKQYDEIIGLIDDRFNEICKIFLIKRNRQKAWYDYDNETEDSRGYFDLKNYKEYIGVSGEWIEPPLGYDLDFPTRWLWEDFEQEMKKTIEDTRQMLEERKEKNKKEIRKKEVAVLKSSIKNKLTPQELKIINFK